VSGGYFAWEHVGGIVWIHLQVVPSAPANPDVGRWFLFIGTDGRRYLIGVSSPIDVPVKKRCPPQGWHRFFAPCGQNKKGAPLGAPVQVELPSYQP
jgi:hypothetical protein